jgi:hypothetical protein
MTDVRPNLSAFYAKAREKGGCGVRFLDLTDQQRADLDKAIWETSPTTGKYVFDSKLICGVLEDWGFTVDHQVISRHRNRTGNRCSCPPRVAE